MSDESLLSYLDGVEHTYDAYVAHVGHPVDFDAFFAANVYHVPFGGLAQRAHLRLARRELGLSKADAERHWRRKSAASLTYNRRTGGLFGGATFIALASLIEQQPLAAGDRIGVYSYGSGSCAEFYSATVCDGARQTVAEIRLASQLDGRRPLSVEEYEACEREIVASTGAADYRSPDALIPGLWDSHYDGRGKLVFLGTRDHYREYAWS